MPDSMRQPRDPNGRFAAAITDRVLAEYRGAHAREHELIDKALDKAQLLREEALTQARQTVDARLEKLNELRAEVLEDRQGYVTKIAFEAGLKNTASQIDRLGETMSGRVDRVSEDLAKYIREQAGEHKKQEEEERTRRRTLTFTLVSFAISIAGLAIALFAK